LPLLRSSFTRFFPVNISDRELVILKHLLSKAQRQIITLLMEREMMTFAELVEFSEKAQSTVSVHLKRLKNEGIVSVRYGELCNLYSLVDKDTIAETLSKYKSSFTDRIVDNYSEIVDEL